MAFEVIQIAHDDASVRKWIERTKAFRLFCLKTAPEAFSATYAQALENTDQHWYDRLANPKAATFVAVQLDRIVSNIVVLGPLLFGPEGFPPADNPWLALEGEAPKEEQAEWHYRINAIFTLPEARGKGIAQALLAAGLKYGADEAAAVGKSFVGSIVVGSNNIPARKLYEKCGFVFIREDKEPTGEGVILLKYPA